MLKTIRAVRLLAACATLSCAASANAGLSFSVSFDDPGGLYAAYYQDITRNTVSAGNDWASRFLAPSQDTTLSVRVGFDTAALGSGLSATSSYLTTQDGVAVYEQGAAHELRTGLDPNGSDADILITLGINGYLQNTLWFDPTPDNPLDDTVPLDKVDARSVLLHEFGHAFAFSGWRDSTTGLLPGGYQSTFDALTTMRGTQNGDTMYFTGQQAQALYGGEVPLTFGNHGHVGNWSARDGWDLVGDLMNGVVFFYGTRYAISPLDLAMMADMGLPLADAPMRVPEPGTGALLLGGLGAAAWAGRRRRRH